MRHAYGTSTRNVKNNKWKRVLELTSKEPWLSRFEEYQDECLEHFTDYFELPPDKLIKKIEQKSDYLAGQLYGICVETFFEMTFDDPQDNVVTTYLKRFKFRMPKDEITILEQMRDKVFSIYEITDLKKGEYLIVEDVFARGTEHKVFEEAGSLHAEPLTYRIAKMIEVSGKKYFTGVAFSLAIDYVQYVSKMLVKIAKKEKTSIEEILRESSIQIFEEAFDELLTPPTVLNANNDKMEFSYIYFEIKNKKQVIKVLDNLSDFGIVRYEHEELFWQLTEKRKKKKTANQIDDILLADIKIQDNKLMCRAITEKAPKKLLKILQENLKNNIGLARIEEANIKNMEPPEELELSEEELSGVLRQYFDEHLKNCLNDKIPILNNMTPKECAKKDPKRLKTWLKMMEENIKEQTQGTYDMSWVYEELVKNK
jgi:hypothetical protein